MPFHYLDVSLLDYTRPPNSHNRQTFVTATGDRICLISPFPFFFSDCVTFDFYFIFFFFSFRVSFLWWQCIPASQLAKAYKSGTGQRRHKPGENETKNEAKRCHMIGWCLEPPGASPGRAPGLSAVPITINHTHTPTFFKLLAKLTLESNTLFSYLLYPLAVFCQPCIECAWGLWACGRGLPLKIAAPSCRGRVSCRWARGSVAHVDLAFTPPCLGGF